VTLGDSPRRRIAVLLAILSVLVIAVIVVLISASTPTTSLQDGSPTPPLDRVLSRPHLVFQNMTDDDFGRIAAVPLTDPGGLRALGPTYCDRSFSSGRVTSCLATAYGVPGTDTAKMLGASLTETTSWKLPGHPTRTTLSRDGTLVATTVFVSGHSYTDTGFSTSTVIRATDGSDPDYGSLEEFSFTKDGAGYSAADINVWGVTFTADRSSFYATVSTGGTAYLARGSLRDRSLEMLRPNVECPSLSPDGQRIAYKQPIGTPAGGGAEQWRLHVLNLDTQIDRPLAETRSVDDQVQWLDDNRIIYGVPRPDHEPDADVWVVPVVQGTPEVLIPHASSPSVVR
jgi:hypothetical protein